MAPLTNQALFDTWARLYDDPRTRGSAAEQAAYDALTLADVDRRAPRKIDHQPITPFRTRLRLLQYRAALRRAWRQAMRPDLIQPSGEGPDLSLSTLLTSAAALAALLFLAGVPYLIGVAK